MIKNYSLLIITFFIFLSSKINAQLTVTSAPTPTTMVTTKLLGPGVYVNNISFTGAAVSRGTFNCTGGCNLGLASGILLTSGSVSNAVGPNNTSSASTDNGVTGDPTLNAISGGTTEDACVLSFDFMVATDSVQFRFVFGSEEYNEFVGSFNDVFGFFISGPNIVGQKNIALIPGTSTIVSINNVNNGTSNPSTGPCTNCAYFRDNFGGSSVQYDGMTTVLTASAKVCPCVVYHIKLAIADMTDHVLDSGVFLEANSFQSVGQIPTLDSLSAGIPNNDTLYICPGDSVKLTLPTCSNALWSTGDTTTSIYASQPGTYFGSVSNALCFAFSTIVYVEWAPTTCSITANGPVNICAGGTVSLTASPGSTYLWSNGATSQTIVVGTAGSYTVTVKSGNNCVATSPPIVVSVSGVVPNITASGPLTFCNGGSVTLTSDPATAYLWSNGSSAQSITVSTSGTYTVTVTQGTCTAVISKVVTVNPNPVPTITGPISICQGLNATLSANAGFSGYSWSNGQSSQSISVNTSGTYTVTVTNPSGCTGTTSQLFTVLPKPTPVITGVLGFCAGSQTQLDAGAGYSIYQWSGGGLTQLHNVTLAGNYTVTVTAANGCTGTATTNVTAYPLPTASIAGSLAICQGSTTTLTGSPTGLNYQWSVGGNPIAGATSITYQTGAAGNYQLTVTDVHGCTGTANQSLFINANPTPFITGNITACQGDSSLLSAGIYSTFLWSTGQTTTTIYVKSSGNYVVTVTDPFGCSGSATQVFTTLPNPTPAITGVTSFCSGNQTQLDAGAGYSSYLWSQGAATTPQINTSTAGNYTVTVTAANGCTAIATTNVTVYPLPVTVITGTNSICQGATTIFTSTPAGLNYLWSNGTTNNTLQTGIAGTYTVTVTDGNGCTGQTNQTLTVNNNPIPIITGPTNVCQGLTATFDAGAGYSGYNWSNGQTSQTTSSTTSGTFTVTVTDGNGCTGNTSQSLTVLPLPTPSITGNAGFCTGTQTQLDAGAGYTNYQWSNGGNTQQQIITSGGNYIVTVTAANGCTATATTNVTAYPLPVAVITGITSICQGTTTTLTSTPAGLNYLWSDGTSNNTLQTGVAGTYTVTVTDGNGCTGQTNQTLTVNNNPVPIISGTFTVCQGSSALLDAGTGYANYTWSNGTGTQQIQPTTSGNYNVIVTDNNGCTGTTSQLVTVNALPLPVITGTSTFCTGNNTTISGNAGFASYLWSDGTTLQNNTITNGGAYTLTVTDGNGCSNSVTIQTTEFALPQPVLPAQVSICQGNNTLLQPGNFSQYIWSDGTTSPTLTATITNIYTVTVTDINGCTGSTSTNVQVNALPQPVIQGPAAICDKEVAVLNAGAGFTSYLWSDGNTGSINNLTAGGTYTVTVTDANGCSGNTDFSFVVHPLPLVAVTGVNSFCDRENSVLTTPDGQGTYSWNTGSNSNSITVTTTGIYSVIVKTGFGCTDSSSIDVIVHPLPVINFSDVSAKNCGKLDVHYINTSVYESGSLFNWNFGDGSTSNSEQPDHSYTVPGDYYVVLQITSPYGCKQTDSISTHVEITPPPVAKFELNHYVVPLLNAEVEITNLSQNATHYKWNFGDGTSSEELNPAHYFDDIGDNKIKLIAYNIDNCIDEYEQTLVVAPYYIPTGFSPNGDGKNDVFFDGSPVINSLSFTMLIFDRWGKEIYKTDSYLQPWDGFLSNGSQAAEGVYTYYINITSIKGKKYEYRGTFSLIR